MIKAFKQTKWYRKLGNYLFKDLIFEAEDMGYKKAISHENHQEHLGRESYFKYLIDKEVIIVNRLGNLFTGTLLSIRKKKENQYVKYIYHVGDNKNRKFYNPSELIHDGFIIEYTKERLDAFMKLTMDERKDLFMKKVVIN